MADVRTLLGFDFGEVRIGVAVGNTLTESAQALTVLASVPTRERFERIARLIAEWQPAALVVGRPVHPDAAEHEVGLAAETVAPDPADSGLDEFGGRSMQPHHEVGVGAHPGHVVKTTHDDVLCGQRVQAGAQAISGVASGLVTAREHRPARVADRVVDLAGSHPTDGVHDA